MEGTENKNVPQQEMQPKSKRDALMERMKGRYPDKNFDTDDALYEQIGSDYDNYENEIGGYKKDMQAFSDMFASDPRTADLFLAFKKGSKKHPAEVLIERFGPELRDKLDDPDFASKLAEENKAWLEKQAKAEELDRQYEENIQKSMDYQDKLESEGVDPKVISDATAMITKIANEVIMGIYSEEAMQMAMKAINHDADVADAARVGEVKGKNTKIKEQLRQSKNGDGMANLAGKNPSPKSEKKRPAMGALDRIGERKSIWER